MLMRCRCNCQLNALKISRKLYLNSLKPSYITLVLVDCSVSRAEGLLENMPVRIGEYYIPTDFIVLKLDEEPEDPIILGRPFVATEDAMINVNEGNIDLYLDELIMKFDINKIIKKPSINGQSF
ncbi:hypothetical protein V5N11_028639 [Cardamine amara subsp. amara]|uniref:Reverse transcriptase domain-containing protein n=1 Tax=Cardamine amara subsp. amara TaxID=228776 RepID=A0ABD1BHH5_CARAN